MGQRHQIFVKIVNPLKVIDKRNQTAKMKTLFGSKDFTILSYHNQWLYGRSALQSALNVLIHCSQFTKAQKVGENGAYHTPFSKNGQKYDFSDTDKLIAAIGFIMNYTARNTDFIDAGISGAWFEPEIRHDFTSGDNNDGITIIDTIENKYCFMNISEWKNRDEGECVHSASDLPYLTPVSAHDYVNAYYGESIDYVNSYHVEKAVAKGKTISDVVAAHARDNNKLVRQFKKFQLLTVEELCIMFPKLTVQLKTANANLVIQ